MTHTYYKRILILPDAGTKNPFQYQMIDLLKANHMHVVLGKKLKLFSLLNAVRNSNPDVIYFDWIHSFILGKSFLSTAVKSFTFLLEIVYLSYLKQIPLIHTAHNIQNHKSKFLLIERIIYKFFLRRCAKVRTYSEAVRNELSLKFNISPDKIYVIQDIPFHHYYANNTTQKESRLKLGLLEDGFLYLFFGRTEPYKGLENLISAFLSIPKSNNYLIIAGESLDLSYLTQLKKMSYVYSRIIWFDKFIAPESIQYFFNAADVIVLPFARIYHSGSIDLSMSFSKPVITCKTPAVVELLNHQDTLLFEKPAQLTNCLLQAKKLNLNHIGRLNFTIANSSNYIDLLCLFRIRSVK